MNDTALEECQPIDGLPNCPSAGINWPTAGHDLTTSLDFQVAAAAVLHVRTFKRTLSSWNRCKRRVSGWLHGNNDHQKRKNTNMSVTTGLLYGQSARVTEIQCVWNKIQEVNGDWRNRRINQCWASELFSRWTQLELNISVSQQQSRWQVLGPLLRSPLSAPTNCNRELACI